MFTNTDEDNDMSPTMIHQAIHAKSHSILVANAPTQLSQPLLPFPCLFPPAMPIKAKLDEPSTSSSLHCFESMDEIIKRQNQ